MARQATWANVGTNVMGSKNVMEAMHMAGLDYNVVLQDVYLGNGVKIEGVKATVQEGTDRVFGTVSDEYGLVQNVESFEFANNLVKEGLKFEKAGETRRGRIWLIGSMPSIKVLDDKMKPYVILQNSHNGTCSLRAAITPLRVVCRNQFSYAFRNAPNVVSLKHSSKIVDRMHEAQSILVAQADYMNEVQAFAEKYATMKISKSKALQILDAMFPQSEEFTDAKNDSMRNKAKEVMYIYNNTDDLQNYHGTAYGLVQAYSDYITHREASRKTETFEERKFTKMTFEPKALNKLVNIIEARMAV